MGSVADLLNEGNRLYGGSLYARAVEAYTGALAVEARGEAYFNRALSYVRLGEYEKALADVNAFLESNGGEASGWYLKSLVLSYVKRYSDAVDAVNRALDIDPYLFAAVQLSLSLEQTVHPQPDVLDALPEYGLKVERQGGITSVKSLDSDDFILSQTNFRSPFVGGFWDLCLTPLFMLPAISRVLLVGVCAGKVARQYAHFTDCTVDAVDPAVKALKALERHFGATSGRIIPHEMDGLDYLRGCAVSYDVIIIDAFVRDSVAPQFRTDDAVSLMRGRLNPDGLLLMNTISEASEVSAILARAFPSVFVFSSYSNSVFLASACELSLDEVKKRLREPSDLRLKSFGEHLLMRVGVCRDTGL